MMTPKTIINESYYSGLAENDNKKEEKDDYYNKSNNKEPAGRWFGKGAEALGLSGDIKKRDFNKIINGFDKNGISLRQNSGKPNFKKGEDLCFSVPKSVTLARRLSSAPLSEKIHKAELTALEKALKYVESITVVRAGPDKKLQNVGGVCFAIYEHSTSRGVNDLLPDPQDHWHCLMVSSALCQDKKFRAIEFKNIYNSQKTIGALFRAELANELRVIGFNIEPDAGDSFKIGGMDEKMCGHFSKRAQQVKAATPDNASPAQKAMASLSSRNKKGELDNANLLKFWKAEALEKFGVNETTINNLILKNDLTLDNSTNESMLNQLSGDGKKSFSDNDLRKTAANNCQYSGRDVNECYTSLKESKGLNTENKNRMTYEAPPAQNENKNNSQNNSQTTNNNALENIINIIKAVENVTSSVDGVTKQVTEMAQNKGGEKEGGGGGASKIGQTGATPLEKARASESDILVSIAALKPNNPEYFVQMALLSNALKDANAAVISAEMALQKQVIDSQIQFFQME